MPLVSCPKRAVTKKWKSSRPSHHSCSIILITSTFPGLAKQKLSSKLVFFGVFLDNLKFDGMGLGLIFMQVCLCWLTTIAGWFNIGIIAMCSRMIADYERIGWGSIIDDSISKDFSSQQNVWPFPTSIQSYSQFWAALVQGFFTSFRGQNSSNILEIYA